MGTLTAFLKEEAERLRKVRPTREQLVADWVENVTGLFDWIESEAKAADTEGVLEIGRRTIPRTERRLGAYTAPQLTVRLDLRAVHFIPHARFSAYTIRPDKDTRIANTGCVLVADRDDPASGAAVFTLYRTPPRTPDGKGFHAVDLDYPGLERRYGWFVRRPGTDPDTPDEPLDPETLERILVGVLQ